jgi:hypothetical protein
LFPFNPDRVLRVTLKPLAQSSISRADEMKVGSCYQDEVPQTPMTLVSAEGLTSLHNIIKQDSLTLTETSIPRLQRHVQKLANAAHMSFAHRALLDDENQLLTRMNNEAKVRRSTKSVVLGKAKVMSYEDIEEARTKRAAKDAAKGKGKRGRKRKSTTQEADESEAEAEPEVAHAAKEVIMGKRKRGRKRKSAVQKAVEPEPAQEVARTIEAPEPAPWRAPVARMY